jgi:hypothetical protein
MRRVMLDPGSTKSFWPVVLSAEGLPREAFGVDGPSSGGGARLIDEMPGIGPIELAAQTDFTVRALEQVRSTAHFGWGVVPLLAIIFYVYATEVQAKNWAAIFAGVGLFLMDVFNEVTNGVILHVSDRAALWTTTGPTLYQPLIGWTAEIIFMFAIAGVIFAKILPEDPKAKLLGLNNRVALVLGFSIFCVVVELILRSGGIFHWEYWFWDSPWGLPTITIFGYATFFAMAAWLYDMGDNRSRQFRVVGTLAAIDAAGVIVFGPVLGWL